MSMMAEATQILKEKGDNALNGGDYINAALHYSCAIHMDPSNPALYLNRSFANLKLGRCSQAEEDAMAAFELERKALYRGGLACIEQGNISGARQDIEASKPGRTQDVPSDIVAGLAGVALPEKVQTLSARDITNLDHALKATTLPSLSKVYKISEAGTKGLGAFAIQRLKRGDLILSDAAIMRVKTKDDGGKLDQLAIASALSTLSPSNRQAFFSLANQQTNLNSPEDGIFWTNAIDTEYDELGIFTDASRFNHSCSPNARYSWDSGTQRLRIHALREIRPGEEILACYLVGIHAYGKGCFARQDRLGFVCECVVCGLPGPDAIVSDQRREEIARIRESIPMFSPNETEKRLQEIARAIHLLRDEGYAADYDEFTNDAVGISAYHSDWDSTIYWATMTYETRIAEFGHDSRRAAEVRCFLDPKAIPMAGAGEPRRFNVR